jgi:hypothetical protein
MEKKEIQEWRDRLIKMFGVYHSDGQEYVTCPLCGINLDELANHMIKELDKAREEGWNDGINYKNWEFEVCEWGTNEENEKRLRNKMKLLEEKYKIKPKLTTK